METNIYLIRHGETEWNQQKRYQGTKDSPLTKKGREQALEAGKSLAKLDFNKAYVSPLKRAQDTIQVILQNRDVELNILDGLREINLGPWEGLTYKEVRETYPETHHYFKTNPVQFQLNGAETLEELQKRVVLELDSIFAREKNKNILVVSHGLSIKAAVAHYSNIPLTEWSNFLHPENGSYFCLSKKDHQISVTPQLVPNNKSL